MAIPTSTNQESQSLTPTALLNLFLLDMSPIGVNTQLYLADMTSSSYLPIVWRGTTYIPFPVQMKDYGYDGNGSLVRPKLSVSNINGFVSALLLQNQDLVGSSVTLTRVFARFIDAVNWPGGVSPYTPDPTAAYAPEVYYINRKTGENQAQVEWELSTAFEVESKKMPSRLALAGFCQFRYRDAAGGCPYVGAPLTDGNGRLFTGPPYNLSSFSNKGAWDGGTSYAPGDYVTVYSTVQSLKGVPLVYVSLTSNVNSNPVVAGNTDWSQDSCTKVQAQCRLRFPWPQYLPFGGYPGLSRSPFVAGSSSQYT